MRHVRTIFVTTAIVLFLIRPATSQTADVPTTLPAASSDVAESGLRATTQPSPGVPDAMAAIEKARANCIERLKRDDNYRAAVAAENDAKQRLYSAAEDDRADAAARLLSARASVRKIEIAAFAADEGVIKAQKELNSALGADKLAKEQANVAAADAKIKAEQQAEFLKYDGPGLYQIAWGSAPQTTTENIRAKSLQDAINFALNEHDPIEVHYDGNTGKPYYSGVTKIGN